MRITSIFLALIFCATLFASCSVDELEDDSQLNKIEDVQASDDENTPPDDDKGNG